MEGDYSTGQSPQWAVVPMEEEEEEEKEKEEEEKEEEVCVRLTIMDLFLNDPLTERDLLHLTLHFA